MIAMYSDMHMVNNERSPMNGLDLNLLLTLRALLAEKHVSRAAAELGTTQPTVSRGLAQLRIAFGDPLLLRTGRGMALTPVGQSLIAPLDMALAAVARLPSIGSFDPLTAQRHFRLLIPDVLGCGVIALLHQELRPYPGLSFAVIGSEGDAVSSLISGRSEIVVSAPPLEHAELYSKVLPFDVPWSVLLGPKHPHWNGGLTYRSWLESEHVQLVPAGQPERSSELEQLLSGRAEQRRIRVQVQYLSGVAESVCHSALVATLPTPTAQWLATQRAIRVLPHPVKKLNRLKVRMTWHALHQQDDGHRWLRERLAQCLTKFLSHSTPGAAKQARRS